MKILTLSLFVAAALMAQSPYQTRNVIIVTADGLRWQDLFTGIDPKLMNEKSAGMEEDGAKELRERLWKDTPEARREALAPFIWKEVVPNGVLYGNLTKGSSARVSNAFRVSYPGYSEILTGRAQDDVIRGNDKIRQPTQTILELTREKLGLKRTQAALIGTWDTYQWIGEKTPGSIVINAGVQPFALPDANPRIKELSQMQFDILTPWDGERPDYITFELALAYLKQYKPRILHIAFGETDDWAHHRRYDRVLESIGYFDRSLARLWATLESMPEYKGKTTLVITSDHGRGATLADYHGHGAKVEGAHQIWMAFRGPDTPHTGEAQNVPEVWQRDIAPTVAELLGLGKYEGAKGSILKGVIRQ